MMHPAAASAGTLLWENHAVMRPLAQVPCQIVQLCSNTRPGDPDAALGRQTSKSRLTRAHDGLSATGRVQFTEDAIDMIANGFAA